MLTALGTRDPPGLIEYRLGSGQVIREAAAGVTPIDQDPARYVAGAK
ncbi:MAG: hypothetical protein ACYSVY_27305 [Planctomycetota bacterium]|jgi:hypothetical protein